MVWLKIRNEDIQERIGVTDKAGEMRKEDWHGLDVLSEEIMMR